MGVLVTGGAVVVTIGVVVVTGAVVVTGGTVVVGAGVVTIGSAVVVMGDVGAGVVTLEVPEGMVVTSPSGVTMGECAVVEV